MAKNRIELVTPPGILSYPNLFKPRPRAEGKEPDFNAVLVFASDVLKTPNYKALVTTAQEVFKEKFPKAPWKDDYLPIRDADEKEQFAPLGEKFISAWSQYQPEILDAAEQDIHAHDDVWAGQLARFIVSPFAWENTGKKGVSWSLQGVQILKSKGMTRLDGRKSLKGKFGQEYAEADEEV